MADAELLLIGYATGTLDEQERRAFERALAEHPEWLPRLADARRFAELFEGHALDSARSPVSAELLVDYVERRDELEPSTVAAIEAELERSPTAREALDCLERLDAPVERVERRSLWERLRETLLAPTPALAYLLLLVLLPALWWGSREATVGMPERLVVPGERVVRDSGQTEIAPLEVDRAVVQLELQSELTLEDMAERRWAIEIVDSAGETIERWPVEGSPRTFEGKARFDFMVDLRSRRSGERLVVRVVADAPGDPLDGQALFRRELRVR